MLLDNQEHYIIEYKQAEEFRNKQASIFWLADEIKVEKDVQDVLVNLTDSERHAVLTTLKLFTKYELMIGEEYWLGRVMKEFKRPDIQSMASLFGATELAIHAAFYNKLNEALSIATADFYNEYKHDEVMSDRIKFIGSVVNDDDIALSLGAFTFVEGAILYSAFAFLKHFQSEGKNKLMNVVAGINFSARDENLHSEASAWMHKTLVDEYKLDKEVMETKLTEIAHKVYEHEVKLIQKLFEKGDIEGITVTQLEHFVQSRINMCMRNMGYRNVFEVTYNPISEWFYKGINGYAMNDFFTSVGNQYERGWQAEGFKF